MKIEWKLVMLKKIYKIKNTEETIFYFLLPGYKFRIFFRISIDIRTKK